MKYRISETEFEVMEMVWKYQEGIKQSTLLKIFLAEGKEWKRQTLNTFLIRLEEKGLLKREKRIVKPVCTREEYAHHQTQEVIDTMYGGRLSNLVLAFTQDGGLSDEEVGRLLRLIQQKKK
ncbi:MAG: BlaI/MecI/CopY family transcriptional regulator [Acetatifactor sp.]|nr:BlaI/MecI/CopY family transcriptional regulator [Acetatifactor sp.]